MAFAGKGHLGTFFCCSLYCLGKAKRRLLSTDAPRLLHLQTTYSGVTPQQARHKLKTPYVEKACTAPALPNTSLASPALNVLRSLTLAKLGQITLLPWPRVAREHGTRIASLGKDQNSKFEFEFLLNMYCFQSIIKSNCKLNHRLSRGPSVLL
ncbi:hypothetical protein mRhiFer1_007992 [Rhinolophus ferrumequinum]|uniref:Uncharacterized protein n=1 Tax=Rhinolophus ferrumequinum TaxID=59479 RepID=A0A7J7WQI4_RHIFE|nr:hypothetical protein mRhiFer1_007992 [Rhinolophus ferrumequinum]